MNARRGRLALGIALLVSAAAAGLVALRAAQLANRLQQRVDELGNELAAELQQAVASRRHGVETAALAAARLPGMAASAEEPGGGPAWQNLLGSDLWEPFRSLRVLMVRHARVWARSDNEAEHLFDADLVARAERSGSGFAITKDAHFWAAAAKLPSAPGAPATVVLLGTRAALFTGPSSAETALVWAPADAPATLIGFEGAASPNAAPQIGAPWSDGIRATRSTTLVTARDRDAKWVAAGVRAAGDYWVWRTRALAGTDTVPGRLTLTLATLIALAGGLGGAMILAGWTPSLRASSRSGE